MYGFLTSLGIYPWWAFPTNFHPSLTQLLFWEPPHQLPSLPDCSYLRVFGSLCLFCNSEWSLKDVRWSYGGQKAPPLRGSIYLNKFQRLSLQYWCWYDPNPFVDWDGFWKRYGRFNLLTLSTFQATKKVTDLSILVSLTQYLTGNKHISLKKNFDLKTVQLICLMKFFWS